MCEIFCIAEISNLISILRDCAVNGSSILCIAQLCTLSSVSCSFDLTQCVLLQGHGFAVDDSTLPLFVVRTVRDIPAASKSGSGAISFASSSSSSGSMASSGSAPGYNAYNARSGSLDGAPGGLIACILCPCQCHRSLNVSHHIPYNYSSHYSKLFVIQMITKFGGLFSVQVFIKTCAVARHWS
jgi:hypothetical protein